MSEIVELRRRAEANLGVPRVLRDYQWEGISFLYRSSSALLADEMGLGKTVQASVALALLMSTNRDIRRALIVAPSSLIMNWMSELETWAPSLTVRRLQGNAQGREAYYLLPIPVLVGSYEQIRQDGLDRIPSDTFDLVIIDEAQRIKNQNSTTSLACRLLPRKFSWALSATPLENDVQDIISILGFLDSSISSELSGHLLAETLENMMLRRRKFEVRSELPPIIIQDLKLELTSPQRLRYDEIWETRPRVIKSGVVDTGILLELITRLKIVCNLDSDSGASSKMDALCEICDGAEDGARILVFSQYVKTLKWIASKVSLPHDLLVGEKLMKEREAAISRFKTGSTPRLLLISLRAGGVGLNLGEATQVVMFDRWWNPAVEMQAIHRAHRFTREKPLHVIRFTVAQTIEERIAVILDRKEKLFDDVIESTKTKGGAFTVQEMMQILEMSNPK